MNKCKRPRVILVGDVVHSDAFEVSGDAYQADNPTFEEVERLRDGLSDAGWHTEVLQSLMTFANGEGTWVGSDDLVFPLWRGGASRNRTALVPGICEARGLRYIGSDAFVHAVCQDKSLSKSVAFQAGLSVPQELVIHGPDQIQVLNSFSFQSRSWIVKPLYGACSIGIDDSAVATCSQEAIEVAASLFRDGFGPVLVEEFVHGREISWCMAGWNQPMHIFAEYTNADGSCPFESKPYTFGQKLDTCAEWTFTSVDSATLPGLESTCLQLVRDLGVQDLFRVDIRLGAAGPVLLELTPDIHLGPDSMFLGGFAASDCSLAETVSRIVEGAERRTVRAR